MGLCFWGRKKERTKRLRVEGERDREGKRDIEREKEREKEIGRIRERYGERERGKSELPRYSLRFP